MRLFEFTAKFNNIHELVKHYKERFPEEIKNGNINGNCGLCAAHFEDFAADNGFGMVERVQGYFTLDKPDYENFTNKEIKQMSQAGLGPKEFAASHNLEEKLKRIPHQWNEFQGQIIDLTGQGQFVTPGMSADMNKSRLLERSCRRSCS